MTVERSSFVDLEVVGEDDLPPDSSNELESLRAIGYSFDQAIADIIDNSIDANAENVLIRFISFDDSVHSIVVADDGTGMTDVAISEAMRIGARVSRAKSALGKFGVGLKLASFSHAKGLTVLSRTPRGDVGRRWLVDNIKNRGWKCDIIDPAAVSDVLDAAWGDVDLARSGTLVVWNDLDKFASYSKDHFHRTWGGVVSRLKNYLGLHFHRFLETGKVSIKIDLQEDSICHDKYAKNVGALNPFDYETSGDIDYPKTFRLSIPGAGKLQMKAHIWQPNSDSMNYKLDGTAASRQGLYFFRNERLIQAGGWNGILKDEKEPHLSLARVSIELPPSMDSKFSLNVQKTSLNVPPEFKRRVDESTARDETTFSQYRVRANKVYRKKDNRSRTDFPLVPAEGVPARLQEFSQQLFAEKDKKIRQLGFVWSDFDPVDQRCLIYNEDEESILLNSRFRKFLLGGKRASKADIPLFKMLVYLVLKEAVDKPRGKKFKALMEDLNKIIVECANLER